MGSAADEGVDDLEGLLQEALADFGAAPQTADAAQSQAASSGQGEHSREPASSHSSLVAPSSKEQNESGQPGASYHSGPVPAGRSQLGGLGLGLGRGLARRPGKQPASANSSSSSSRSRPGAGSAAEASSVEGSSQPSSAAQTSGSQQGPPSLPPDIQKLADELLKLVEEAGIGGGQRGSSGQGEDEAYDLDSEEDLNLLRQLIAGNVPGAEGALDSDALRAASQAAAGSSVASGASSSLHSGPSLSDNDSMPQGMGRSGALQGLLQQTRRTIEEQNKLRGPGTSAGSRQAGEGGRREAGGRRGGRPASAGGIAGLLGALGGGGEGAGGLGLLEGLLNSSGGEGGEGLGTNFMVDFIMRGLLSKDVLYNPLKEIRDKYPPWLEKEAPSLSEADMARYKSQLESIQAVCRQYEEDPNNFSRLLELIQKMQEHGDPPAAIVEDISASIRADMSQGSTGAGSSDDTGDDDARFGLSEEDLQNMQLPPDLLQNMQLPSELQKECTIM